MNKLKDMNQDQLIAWINTLPFSDQNKKKIIIVIKKFAKESGDPVRGSHFIQADAEDIKQLTSECISINVAEDLLQEVNKKKDQDFPDLKPDQSQSNKNDDVYNIADNNGNSNNDGKFTLNLIAQQGGMVKIKNVDKSWKVSRIKAAYLEEFGNEAAADKYRKEEQWDGNEGKIDLKKLGKSMQNDKTLDYYDIRSSADCRMPLHVVFKCRGGAEVKHDDDDINRYRVRKLRRIKYKEVIKLSNKPDCIMGYTDADKIRRAEMPCGCAIAADTMWRYMKALFEKDFKGTKLFCPTPKKLCNGSDQQREWPWNLIYIIADLSPQEIAKYSRIINNRIAGTKDCPHCGATTERPKELRICRVACNQCNNSDWCWNCTNVWKSSGLGPICGNEECMGAQINKILEECEWIEPRGWYGDINIESLTCPGKEGKVPELRACPKCCSMIQYTNECKHMWCLCCPHEFCFNCLGAWGGDGDGQCKHGKLCDLYKRDGQFQQIFT